VFPLDTLKTRLQSPSFQQQYRSAAAISNRALWRGLYQGVGPAVLVAIPSSGVFFATYEGLKYLLGDSSSRHGVLPQPAVHALSSSIAQLVNCAVVTPAEVLKQNAQMLTVQQGAPKALSSPTMFILRQIKQHPTKLWRGYTVLVARDLPFAALQFPMLEYLKGVLLARRSRLKKSGGPVDGVLERAWISGMSASMAGSAAAWVTTPLDVVKTRIMLEAGAKDSPAAQHGSSKALMDDHGRRQWRGRRRNGFRICSDVFRSEGISGFFRGASARTLFTAIGNGLFIGCYEGARCYLQEREEAKGSESAQGVRGRFVAAKS